MKVVRIILKEGERPIKNNMYIDTRSRDHEGYEMTFMPEYSSVYIEGPSPGEIIGLVPMTSISCIGLASKPESRVSKEPLKIPVPPTRKSRPKKSKPTASAATVS